MAETAVETAEAPQTEGAAPIVETKARGFEAFSDPAFMGKPVDEAPVVNTATETAPATNTAPLAATNAETASATPNADAAIVEEEKPIEAFKIPGVESSSIEETPEQKAQKEAIAVLETDQSWINLAKVQNVDITEDSFDAYNRATMAKFEADKTAAIEAVRQEKFDLELNKLPVEAVAIIEGLKEGYTVEDIFAPIKQIDALLSLSNEELVAEDLRLQEWSPELIEKKIADLIETDKLDLEAQPLRVLLNNNKKAVAQNQVDKFAQLQQQRVEHEKQVRTNESETIRNTITSMKEYMGVPITPEVINHIQQKWTKGEYHDAFKNPKAIAEFLMYTEFGDQGLKAMKNREYQRGRDEKANKLHNIPPVSKTGAVVTPKQIQKSEGNFEALRR